jgi:sirohydrochlorin cobaltochelatase
MSNRNAALLLLGHGSTLNADSSAPTYQHAEEIRRRGLFGEVHVAFWKEEPNFRQALRQTSCRTVYVVPNFISSGYFTEQIIPRELGLTGPVTKLGEQSIYYCAPVGLSRKMTEVLLARAEEVVAASGETCDPKQTCVFICGHGTSFNDNSTKIIYEQATIIRGQNNYADCQAVLMEQQPFVKDWRTLTPCPNVIVVPFFISDGLHSYEDIPVLLGLTPNIREKGFTNPHRENDRRLWYANAIGTEPFIADVIIDSTVQFDADHFGEMSFASKPRADVAWEEWNDLLNVLSVSSQGKTIGQVQFAMNFESKVELRHIQDRAVDISQLKPIGSLAELREMILRGPQGEFRPLRAAPNLCAGWVMTVENFDELRTIVDYIYPAEIANASLWKKGELPITSWRETAERQTGRFRIVREIDDAGIRELAAQFCDPGCLKRRLWPPCAQPVETAPGEIPLLCPEACNFLVGKARERLKGADEEAS